MNEALWDWYVICRNSNIPVSGTMLQEEGLMIAEKMGISGFAASNGWLESFKKQHNLHHMAIAGEDGDVKDETIENGLEKSHEGGSLKMCGIWTKQGAFGEDCPKQA